MAARDAYDVIVIGGGAAGLFCAARAGRRGRRVLLLERNAELGRKILISGGGRCNFTNLHCRPEHFLSANPPFVRSALSRFTPADFVALVEQAGIAYHEKTLGQLFCDGSARQIVAMLADQCRSGGVRLLTGCAISSIAAGYDVETSHGAFEAPSLVIASGGVSVPRMGATDFGYGIARQFGVPVVETRPGLVPLLFDDRDLGRWSGLAGVAADCVASCGGAAFRERLLFTHRGLSGPAILQVSSYWRPGGSVDLDLLPGIDLAAELASVRAAGGAQTPRAVVARHLPRRLADRWFQGETSTPVAATGHARVAAISQSLHRWRVVPAGTEGYAKAEVTAGGVDTRALSSRTMECLKVPGLYFIGEVVDVTGHLGGFNFQWAWASAAAAADALSGPVSATGTC